MSEVVDGSRVDLRCSLRTRAGGVVPVSTAAPAVTQVLVETPLPWPSDLAGTDLHRAVADAAGPGARVHGVVPRPDRPAGEVAVVVHAAPPGPFTRYRRATAVASVSPSASGSSAARSASASASVDAIVEVVADLVAGLAARADVPERRDPAVDLLVCTHGSRDRCCGAFGSNLAAWAERSLDVDVWRASHLGGHRFAPTALHLPTGTTWAWLEPDDLDAVVHRTRPPAELIDRYRGSAGVGLPAAQVLEAEAFARVGWAWLETGRDVVVHDEPVPGREWDIEVAGAGRRWRATIVRTGSIDQPACGRPEAGPKTDPVWEVLGLTEDVLPEGVVREDGVREDGRPEDTLREDTG